MKTDLSIQYLLNCGIGSCSTGGSHFRVYSYIYKKYAVPLGCAVYTGTSPSPGEAVCSNVQECSAFLPENKEVQVPQTPIQYKIKNWGMVQGPQ